MTAHLHLTPSQLLATHESRIALVRQYANEASAADFDQKWLSVLVRCAAWFSSMPLRAAEHAEPGGAFRATVEAAYFAMRLSGAQKFAADQPSERRRALEPQYLYALFLAACCSRLDEPCRHFRFIRASDNAEWVPAAHGAFGPWLGDAGYHVRRRETALPLERMRTALLANEVLGAERLGTLDSQVLTDLFGAINPDSRPSGAETLLHKVVRQAIEALTQFEVKARRAEFAPDATPAPSADRLSANAPSQEAPPAPSARQPATADTQGSTVVPEQRVPEAAAVNPPATAPATTEPPNPTEPSRNVVQLEGAKSLRKEHTDDPFKALSGTSNLMREFFKALAQDVAAGKAKVTRVDGKVAISKHILSNYGIASDTLIENLRKFKHLYKTSGQDILLVDEVGDLISPPVESQ